jgi:16S rRNA (uracil1498-N3)-methyltransferase
MRVKIGENFSLFNKTGEWLAKIDKIHNGNVEFSIQEQLRKKENLQDIWLAFSPIKSNYSNFMIQKATELGITKFFPIIFDRSIVRKINSERLEKIIIEATEQSNRLNPPYLEKTQNLKTFLEKNQSTMDLIFTDLNSNQKKIDLDKKSKKPLCIIIGPEGDFSEKEREAILNFKDVKSVKINENILRSETAVISSISIVNYILNL